MKLSDIITLLKNTPKTNDKKKILASHVGNNALKLLFQMTYDNQYTYWIKATMPSSSGTSVLTREILEDVLYQLHGRVVTGNAARDYLENILSNLQPAEQQVLVNCINRDMDCKVSESLINATWKDLIYSFPVMLAGKFNEKTAKPFYEAEAAGKGMVVQLKCDGGRMTYVTSSKAGYSRNASQLLTHNHFDFMNTMFAGYAVDGELLAINTKTGKFESRKVSNGLYTKAVRGTLSVEEAAQLHFVVWDLIPLSEFKSRKGTTPYKERLANLETLIKFNLQYASRISLVKSKLISTVLEAEEFYAEMLAAGEEGAMLKLVDSVWEDDRSNNVLKLKSFVDLEAKVIDWEEGAGKYKGMLGALRCKVGDIEFSVGTGFSDTDRKTFTKEYSIDKIVTVKYNEIITSKNRKTRSLFLPVFLNFRFDISESELVVPD